MTPQYAIKIGSKYVTDETPVGELDEPSLGSRAHAFVTNSKALANGIIKTCGGALVDLSEGSTQTAAGRPKAARSRPARRGRSGKRPEFGTPEYMEWVRSFRNT